MRPVRFKAGQAYEIPRRVFHTTRVKELTVTLVHRSDFDAESARVLTSGEPPKSGIVKHRDAHHGLTLTMRKLVEAAYRAVERADAKDLKAAR